MDKTLSICIPCRVEEGNQMTRYCQRCVDSIQNNIGVEKWFDSFEVVLVDDASCDDSLSKLRLDERLNFKYIRNETRRGIGGSRNVALDACDGKYVHYVDADDYVANNYVEKLLRHIEEDKEKDVQLYLLSFVMTTTDANGKETQTASAMNYPDYACVPVSSCCKVVRRDRCERHREEVYLEDVDHCFRQLDRIDGQENVVQLSDVAYWCYDNTRPTAYSRTANFLGTNHYTMEQLSVGNVLVKNNLKDRAISDLLRACASLYDLRSTLKHENVRNACLMRLNTIWNKILTNNYTH